MTARPPTTTPTKLELRLQLGDAALVTRAEIGRLFPQRDDELVAWIDAYVAPVVLAGHVYYRWGDIVEAGRHKAEASAPKPVRPRLRRATLPTLGSSKRAS